VPHWRRVKREKNQHFVKRGVPTMFRYAVSTLVTLFVFALAAAAADKEVKGKLVRVDLKKKTLTVQTDDGNKVYTISDDTKFIGPKGGESDAGIKDDRLTKGAELKLIIAGNNRTVREVHLPERKKEK
jgi:hypothetical protein